jgi:hypothetical protein
MTLPGHFSIHDDSRTQQVDDEHQTLRAVELSQFINFQTFSTKNYSLLFILTNNCNRTYFVAAATNFLSPSVEWDFGRSNGSPIPLRNELNFLKFRSSPSPDQLAQASKRARHTKEHGVVLVLLQAVVLEQNSRVRVHVWPWIVKSTDIVVKLTQKTYLGLALLQQNVRRHLVHIGNQLEHLVIGQMLQSKLSLASVTWIGLSEDSMSVALK